MVETITLIYKKIVSVILNNIVLVATLCIGIYYALDPVEYNPGIVFLNVGQGDAILIIDKSGKKFLIDGGDGDYVVYRMAKYLHPKDRKIDTIILTHPHQDHLSGLIDIIQRYEVDEILYYPVCYNSKLYEYFLALDENISVVSHDYVYEGILFSLKVFYPLEAILQEECLGYSNINNGSIVVKLYSDSINVLFMGDAEHEQEDAILRRYKKTDLESNILKAGHHCSRTASSIKFLNTVDPQYAICSVGLENKFGHPHREVIQNFESLGIDYYLTSEKGDIFISL
jgi:competence protein ComEC